MPSLEVLLLTFIPLFVAIDAIGIVPLYLGLTGSIEDKTQKKKLVFSASIAALIVCILFLFIGDAVLRFLNITVDDFRIAGGIILLIISANDLLFSSSRVRDIKPQEVGVVPLGIPLIAGPAALTTILITVNDYGYTATLISLLVNILITYLALSHADQVKKLLGESGSKAFAKVASLFLAAIAVMMIRVGIMSAFKL